MILRVVQDKAFAKAAASSKRKGGQPAEGPTKRSKNDKKKGIEPNNVAANADGDEKPAENEITAAGSERLLSQNAHNDDEDEEMTDVAGPSSSSRAQQHGLHATPGANDTFQRLGYWRCRLCTSQKYLNAPVPKQPSEPGTWPLRDISKMVTHYTRMHGEHNNVERCMELGAALRENRGPFRHWLVRTKKENVDIAIIDATIEELENGQLPGLLRRVSKSAADFPAN